MAGHPRLRIAYLCDISPLDRNLYSGGNARIHDALQRHVGDVTILSNGWHIAEPVRRALHRMPEAIILRARWRTHLLLSRLIARGVAADLRRGAYDVLFGAYAFQALAHVDPPPGTLTVYTSDATQTAYRRSEIGARFGSYLSLSRAFDPFVERAERQVFRRADLLLWPSDWIKKAADTLYGLDDATSHLVPWGANLDDPPPPRDPPDLKADAPVQLLLVGRDWFAKGGPLAFDTMQTLRNRGIDARLTVVGCTPPDFHRSDHVTVIPQLDKSVPAQRDRFNAVWRAAHFLVMPSFESFGFVFCEAAAYGLPALCLRVGGVPVRDGVTGHALPPGSDPAAFADRIAAYLSDIPGYRALCTRARREFDEVLNWDSWGRTTARLIHAARDRQT